MSSSTNLKRLVSRGVVLPDRRYHYEFVNCSGCQKVIKIGTKCSACNITTGGIVYMVGGEDDCFILHPFFTATFLCHSINGGTQVPSIPDQILNPAVPDHQLNHQDTYLTLTTIPQCVVQQAAPDQMGDQFWILEKFWNNNFEGIYLKIEGPNESREQHWEDMYCVFRAALIKMKWYYGNFGPMQAQDVYGWNDLVEELYHQDNGETGMPFIKMWMVNPSGEDGKDPILIELFQFEENDLGPQLLHCWRYGTCFPTAFHRELHCLDQNETNL